MKISSVVHMVEQDGIVQITMEDRQHKNMFSEQLIEGLRESFATIEHLPQCKVVILTGYDNYFASGGTQEGLLAIQDGRSKFTDLNLYSLALNCRVPVISAMQGHGIGGGFVMGLFSDVIILSQESIYNTNFMKYGFTPGFGSTYIVPRKLGFALAQEMLLTAENYRGAELAQRGVPFKVLPRTEVLQYAYKIAESLADKPTESLITLKDHLVASIRSELGPIIQEELQMHEKTFHQEGVRQRIVSLFGQ
ncbi:polyketide biosynthesis enoyl-CoA hydratase PksI [Paenibacillus shirakamiensis]|uniref:Polyketide biosynthesis enoyl-CoA hydratase PksI n=1 Tax=Paenibacillus shirakamiensis TaxID=1265935 RepID=A0ABS4JI06_9BACL|nr:polyketide synthase [Paenibacillus shirakamiensis]MBP2000174.1 polyketide biosynthesis enoyl-CoA hydratase PksI [Paenibacillus shirakamiensis]